MNSEIRKDKEQKENSEVNILDELGGAVIRIIDLIGKSVDKGASTYKKVKSEGRDKEFISIVSVQVNTVITKVKW